MRTPAAAAFAACAMTAQIGIADPCEPVRIAPPSVVPPLSFGGSLAVDGRFWFIGDSNARVLCPEPFGCTAGAVHVYEMVDGLLEHRQMLTAPVPVVGDSYGRTIDTHNGRLLVSSINTSWPGLEAKGGGYIYEFDGERWVLTGDLRPPAGIDRFFTDQLGGFSAIEDDTAYLRPANREFVFSYVLRDGAWEFLEMIENPDGLPREAGFGFTIVPHGSWVFMSAFRDSSLVRFGGSVYAYRREPDGTLILAQKIVPTDVPAGVEDTQGFGQHISFDGETLAIGAIGARRPESSTGAVLLFRLVDGQWTFQQEVIHPSAEENDQLGWSVTVHGDVLLSPAINQATPTTTSSLHLFRREGDGQWRHDKKLVPNVPIYARHFAGGAILQDQWVLASSPDDADGSGLEPGAAYLFDISCTSCKPDLDSDGALTIFDFLAFFNAFDAGDPIADFDGDGELTIFDFLAFQTAFDAGCS